MEVTEPKTSLLYEGEDQYEKYRDDAIFTDLNIKQIVGIVTKELDEYELEDIYRQKPLRKADVEFRQAIVLDLLEDNNRIVIERFLHGISRAKRYLRMCSEVEAGETTVACKWHLDGANAYCETVDRLKRDTPNLDIRSEGLRRFFTWLDSYIQSESFDALSAQSSTIARSFDDYRYSISIDMGNDTLTLGDDYETADYLDDLFGIFGSYDLSGIRRETVAYAGIHMNSLEKRMLTLLIANNSSLFTSLKRFNRDHIEFIDPKLISFERQAVFYLSYLAYMRRLKEHGHEFALPIISDVENLLIEGGYDLSLAQLEKKEGVVVNDLHIAQRERSLLLTGPNQGGKTTFARMLGQILFFASAGLPAPCRNAQMYMIEDIQTHFSREEEAGSQSGRLQDELLRLKHIISGIKRNSFVILNELFSSTTTYDACEMGKRILRTLADKDCLCLFVTHIYELTQVVPDAVSLVAQMDDGNPPLCTYRILRRPADGAAYSARLLKKYCLRQAEIEMRKNVAIPVIR